MPLIWRRASGRLTSGSIERMNNTLPAHDHRDDLKSFALPSVLEEYYEKHHDFDDHDDFQLARWLLLEDGKRALVVSGLIDAFTPNANDPFSIGLFRHLRGIDPDSTGNSLNEWIDSLCISELVLESTVQTAMLAVQTAIEFVRQAKAYLQKDPVKIERFIKSGDLQDFHAILKVSHHDDQYTAWLSPRCI